MLKILGGCFSDSLARYVGDSTSLSMGVNLFVKTCKKLGLFVGFRAFIPFPPDSVLKEYKNFCSWNITKKILCLQEQRETKKERT